MIATMSTLNPMNPALATQSRRPAAVPLQGVVGDEVDLAPALRPESVALGAAGTLGTKVRRIGSSSGVILPKPVLQAYGMRDGDPFDIVFTPHGVLLKPRI
jgi:hypothetical protein